MSIDDATALAERFVELEHTVLRALILEPDDQALEAARQALADLFAFPGILTELYRAPGTKLPAPDEAERQLRARVARRRVLAVASYADAGDGVLYAATLTSTMGLGGAPPPVPDIRQIMQERSGELRIVARQGVCMSCGGSGLAHGRPCHTCGGAGWEYLGGAQVSLGEPDDTRVIEGGAS